MPKTGIHWFRHGLRLHDNPALIACQDEVERFIPIFIFDGKTAGKPSTLKPLSSLSTNKKSKNSHVFKPVFFFKVHFKECLYIIYV